MIFTKVRLELGYSLVDAALFLLIWKKVNCNIINGGLGNRNPN